MQNSRHTPTAQDNQQAASPARDPFQVNPDREQINHADRSLLVFIVPSPEATEPKDQQRLKPTTMTHSIETD